jgi:hypothetical protein
MKIGGQEVLIHQNPEFSRFWKNTKKKCVFKTFSEYFGINIILFYKILQKTSKFHHKTKYFFVICQFLGKVLLKSEEFSL